MLDSVIYEILNLKWLIICFFIFSSILFLVRWLLTSKFEWNNFKVNTFSLLYGLDTKQLVCVGIMLTRFLYVLVCVFDNSNFSLEYLFPLLLMSILISVLMKDYIGIVLGVVQSIAAYIIIYLESSIIYYYINIEKDILTLFMAILLAVFMILFNYYTLVSTYNALISLDAKKKIKLKEVANGNN